MAQTQKGFGVVWGVNGITFTGYSGTAYYNVQTAGNERTATRKEIMDGNGELVGQVFHDARKKMSITVVPTFNSATSGIAGAKASMDALTPAVGTAITITDADGTIFDGVYSCLSAKLNRSNTGEATIDMELELSEANSGATTATT